MELCWDKFLVTQAGINPQSFTSDNLNFCNRLFLCRNLKLKTYKLDSFTVTQKNKHNVTQIFCHLIRKLSWKKII